MLVPTPQAVIFDMDGLMLDTEAIYQTVWQRAAAELGVTMSDADYLHFVGRRIADCHTILRQLYGEQFPVVTFLERSFVLYHEHVGQHGTPPKPGLVELLDVLDTHNIAKAVATSTERVLALQCLGDFARRFDVIVTGDEVREGKPHPEIFLLAAHRLYIAPNHCLVLEDSEVGAEAALRAGMAIFLVPDLKQPSEQIVKTVSGVYASLHDVKDALVARV